MAEKSLDDQLKEIQIAREQAELEKVKEETALGSQASKCQVVFRQVFRANYRCGIDGGGCLLGYRPAFFKRYQTKRNPAGKSRSRLIPGAS